jgi:hypothetical protein
VTPADPRAAAIEKLLPDLVRDICLVLRLNHVEMAPDRRLALEEVIHTYLLALPVAETGWQPKPKNYVQLLREARRQVEASPLYERFIKHTPLENDIAVWMASFAAEVRIESMPLPAPPEPPEGEKQP